MEPLRIIPLGGLGEFGLNMMLLEYGDSAIAIDCGLMFPGADLLGIDLVVPDVSYLLERRDKLKAIVLTHAHEDHVGALPYILKHLSVPIFGTRLTLGLLDNKLKEHDLEDDADIREITAGEPWEIAPFQIEGIRVTHSLMDCLALAIETPIGTVIHTGDFKIDNTPMEGEMFDFQRFAAYGEKGVLLLMSDSTNVERSGYTPSEREVGGNLEQIIEHSTGKVLVSTFSSSIPRIQQVVDISERSGRRGPQRTQHDSQQPGRFRVGIPAPAQEFHDRKRTLAKFAFPSSNVPHDGQPRGTVIGAASSRSR